MARRERYLRTSEVANRLQVSPKTIARWAKEGRLPYQATLGGHRRFPASAIDQMMDDLTEVEGVLAPLAGSRTDAASSGFVTRSPIDRAPSSM